MKKSLSKKPQKTGRPKKKFSLRHKKSRGTWIVYDNENKRQIATLGKNKKTAEREFYETYSKFNTGLEKEAHLQTLIQCVRSEEAAWTWEALIRERFLKRSHLAERTKATYESTWNNPVFDQIRDKQIFQTTASDLIAISETGGNAAKDFVRQIHNYGRDNKLMNLQQTVPASSWGKPQRRERTAISVEHYQALIAGIDKLIKQKVWLKRGGANNGLRVYRDWSEVYLREYQYFIRMALWTGASQEDLSNLTADNIHWGKNQLRYVRAKNKWRSRQKRKSPKECICQFGPVEEITTAVLRKLPKSGFLFPILQQSTSSNRGRAFKRIAVWSGVELPKGDRFHIFRYACAKNLRREGYTREVAMQWLGHESPLVHEEYAKCELPVLNREQMMNRSKSLKRDVGEDVFVPQDRLKRSDLFQSHS